MTAEADTPEAKLRQAVDEALVAFPPLTDEVKAAIAHLLTTGMARDGAKDGSQR